ncbi:MAG: sialate O-acetylesterase [Odoribacteraceae bacterium]|nr:sialate O-acetylesterase [Odoribacteraceae bacterium]
MKKNVFVCLLLFLTAFGFPVVAGIRLPAIFAENMVLQQRSRVAVWGWTGVGERVKVTCSWDKKSYPARGDASGYWRVMIPTPGASYTPHALVIRDGDESVTIGNVLVGEVWLCSGQSNMEMPMKGFSGQQPVEGGPRAIAGSRNPGIRCFTVARKSTIVPQTDCSGKWEIAGPETVPAFTATGYFFARLLNQALDVPVGLVHASWGGSRIEAWMSPASLSDIPEKTIPATDSDIKIANGSPAVLYNGMLHPIVGYGMRGAIWYQGEANRGEPDLYVKMFDRMVRGWRDLWGVGEFPLYYCQIAPYDYDGNLHSGYIREAQARGLETPNTGMAVLMDADSPKCIHPPKKQDAGERLALWALARTYGMEKMHYRSPEVKGVEVEGRVAIITFEMFGSTTGLTSYGKELLNFQVAGEDRRFYPAKAALSGNKVYLFAPAVAHPVAVRYCFDNTSPAELFSVEGNLPVSSFRTDKW